MSNLTLILWKDEFNANLPKSKKSGCLDEM